MSAKAGPRWDKWLIHARAGNYVVGLLEATGAHQDKVAREIDVGEHEAHAAPVAGGAAVTVDYRERTDQRVAGIIVVTDIGFGPVAVERAVAAELAGEVIDVDAPDIVAVLERIFEHGVTSIFVDIFDATEC